MVDVNTQEKPQEDFYSSLAGPLTEAIGPIADPMTRLLREKDKATETEMQQKATREAAGASGKAQAARQFATAQQQAFKGYDKLPERPKDTITQDTQQGLQGLAMLLPVAGLFLGAVGNTSGVNAMNAMTGILKGYKEGNDQRIAFETKKYENAIKEWEANYKKAKEGIDRAIEIAKTNYQAGVAEAEAAARKIGSTELAAMVRSKTLGEIQTMMNKVGQDYQTHKNKVEQLTARPQRPMPVIDKETSSQVFATPSEVAQNPDRYMPIQRQAAGVKEREPGDVTKRVIGKLVPTIQNTESLLEKLNDPAFAAKLDKYRMQSFFREEGGKIASQFLSKNIPDDVKKFIIGVTALRNDYYLDISGKTVTNNEAMRNYNAVPQPGDGSDEFKIKLGILLENYQNLSDGLKQQYPEYMKRFSPAGVPRAKTSEEKFATQADVQETARVRFNGNVEAAKKALRERGFKIEGE